MKVHTYIVSKQVEAFCPSCNSRYLDFVRNVSTHYSKGWNNEVKPIYYGTCDQCLDAMRNIEIYLLWQKLVFVNKTLSFNLSPLYKLYK